MVGSATDIRSARALALLRLAVGVLFLISVSTRCSARVSRSAAGSNTGSIAFSTEVGRINS
jgi:hypothetical protein